MGAKVAMIRCGIQIKLTEDVVRPSVSARYLQPQPERNRVLKIEGDPSPTC